MKIVLRIFSYIFAIAIGAVSSWVAFNLFAFVNHDATPVSSQTVSIEPEAAAVEARLKSYRTDLENGLCGFSSAVSNDRNFSVKLLVEQDTAAAEVVGIAALYKKAMRFDLLDICDSAGKIISDGDGAVQGSLVHTNPSSQDFLPMSDSLVGTGKVLTLQARIPFQCSNAPLFASGGVILDNSFFNEFSPSRDCRLIMRHNDELFGMDAVKTISQYSDGKILIDNEPWIAAPIDPGFGADWQAWIVMRKPPTVSQR